MNNNNLDAEELGKLVRKTWLDFCTETKLPQSHAHSAPWEELSQWEKEVDRRIGEAVSNHVLGLVEDNQDVVVDKLRGLLERVSKKNLHSDLCEKILVPEEPCNCGADVFQAEVSSALSMAYWSSEKSLNE